LCGGLIFEAKFRNCETSHDSRRGTGETKDIYSYDPSVINPKEAAWMEEFYLLKAF